MIKTRNTARILNKSAVIRYVGAVVRWAIGSICEGAVCTARTVCIFYEAPRCLISSVLGKAGGEAKSIDVVLQMVLAK